MLTYREGEVGHNDALRSVIGDLAAGDLVRVRLRSLSEAAVGLVLEGSDYDAAEVYTVTGGNPFYVTEMLRAEAGGVPASVRDSVMARVARLDDKSRELVEFVSVVPGDVELTLVDTAGLLSLESLAAAENHEVLVSCVASLHSISPALDVPGCVLVLDVAPLCLRPASLP